MKTPPERWTTRATPERQDNDEARAGRVLRQAVVKQPLSVSALDAIRNRLPDEERGPLRRRVFSVGVAVALFLSGGAVVMSATLLTRWSPFRRAPAPTKASITTATLDVPRVHHAVAAARAAARAAPAPLAPASEPPKRVRAPQPSEAPPIEAITAPMSDAPPPVVVAPALPSPIAEEAALLGAALRKLREQDDAAGALVLLDEHDGRFSASGALADEASTTRVEALLRLGRHARALALLDAQAPRPVGRGRELFASRGELRADAGRCREAIADFDALLADDGATDGPAERALYGRAACRVRMDDAGDARTDLQTYLARYPEGRFAARAREALDR
jgi:hypothetical protein